MAGALEAPDPAPAPGGREVAALRKDEQRVLVAEARRQLRDLALRVAAARVDKAIGQPVAEDVEQRLQAQRLVQHDARAAAVADQQLVQDEQRVALAGVAAEHDQRPAQRGSACSAAAESVVCTAMRVSRVIVRWTPRRTSARGVVRADHPRRATRRPKPAATHSPPQAAVQARWRIE